MLHRNRWGSGPSLAVSSIIVPSPPFSSSARCSTISILRPPLQGSSFRGTVTISQMSGQRMRSSKNTLVRQLLSVVMLIVAIYPESGRSESAPPAIESVIPVSGSVGDVIKIKGSGFTRDNDIEFRSQGAAAYINNGVVSSDGRTLTFTIPGAFSACAFSTMNGACIAIAIGLLPGSYDISVLNANGQSNTSVFTFTPYPSRGG